MALASKPIGAYRAFLTRCYADVAHKWNTARCDRDGRASAISVSMSRSDWLLIKLG